jgi:general L-amino acid transport system substrate-binding protein
VASAATLDDVKARGELNCGVSTGVNGFSAPDASGEWQGFDVAVCRAVAAAVLGDPKKVKFVTTTGQTRFTALASGEVDMLARNSTWTFSRDTDLKLDFVGVNYYDGQGFMVNKDMGITSAKELDGATVCIQTGTTTELNLADYFRVNNMTYEPVPIEKNEEAQQQYLARACDVYTTDASGLAATRATFADPENHIILPEIISKEPLGPVVRHGDNQWADIVRWTLYALVAAEEYGVTSANIEELAKGTTNPEINRLLGTEGEQGVMLGLDKDWAKRAIQAGGNYGEIFAAHIGESTPVGLARGLNALWTQGGLQYAPPFR